MVVALADMALNERLSPEFLATRQQQRAGAALVVADLNLPMESITALLEDAVRDGVSLVLVAVSEPKNVSTSALRKLHSEYSPIHPAPAWNNTAATGSRRWSGTNTTSLWRSTDLATTHNGLTSFSPSSATHWSLTPPEAPS